MLCDRVQALTMMTDTPAVVLLCFGAVLKCVCSLPVTSIFMLFPMTSSCRRTSRQSAQAVRFTFYFHFKGPTLGKPTLPVFL